MLLICTTSESSVPVGLSCLSTPGDCRMAVSVMDVTALPSWEGKLSKGAKAVNA